MPRKFDNFKREIVEKWKSTKLHNFDKYLNEKGYRRQETLAESKQCYIPKQVICEIGWELNWAEKL